MKTDKARQEARKCLSKQKWGSDVDKIIFNFAY